jgi:Protein of unknown function (DUF3152)
MWWNQRTDRRVRSGWLAAAVALNADRWREAVETWPGTLLEYRQMLVNHEVGHLLGRHHARPACEEPGGVVGGEEQLHRELAADERC